MVELIGDTNDSTRGIDSGWLCHQSRVAAAASDPCKKLPIALEHLDPVVVGVGNCDAPIGKYGNAGGTSELPGPRTTFTDDPDRGALSIQHEDPVVPGIGDDDEFFMCIDIHRHSHRPHRRVLRVDHLETASFLVDPKDSMSPGFCNED